MAVEIYPAPEGFFTTTLSADLTTSASTISLVAVPTRITKGYAVIEPGSATLREVVHFTSVGATSITTADDTTDAGDATGRGCIGSVTVGANTPHSQGVTVLIAAVEQYWDRVFDAFAVGHTVAGLHTLGSSDTITSSKVITSLNDTNGNELVKVTATASAVNEITVANAATNNNPVWSATGGDSNVGWDIKMKGTGAMRKPTVVHVPLFGPATSTSTGDGKAMFEIPEELNGMNITGVGAYVYTAGTTNTTDIQIRNVTDAVDVLSTKITIDSTEKSSRTAATPAVIDTTKDDIVTGDLLAFDVDAISTTPAAGLTVWFRAELP